MLFTNLFLILDDGELFGWGNNEYGQLVGIKEIQLAVPYTVKHNVPGKIIDIAVGGSFCLVLTGELNTQIIILI